MNRISYYRRKLGLTQKILADKIGVSPSSIAMYETEKRIPNVFLAIRMSKALDVHIISLFSEETYYLINNK